MSLKRRYNNLKMKISSSNKASCNNSKS